MDKARDKRADRLIVGLLIVLTLAIYWQVWDFEFSNYDDDVYVSNNIFVKAGLVSPTVRWAFTTTHASLYQPLVWLSYMLETDVGEFIGWIVGDEIGKDNAGIYHLTNVVLHVANSVLLFLLLSRMTGLRWRSAFVAALFAVHPLHVESVAWVAERKDVLSTLFWMLTTLAYVSFVRRDDYRSRLWMLLWFVLGLLSKPMLVMLPVTLLLLDYWPLGRYGNRGLPTSPDPSFARRGEGNLTPASVASALHSALSALREKLPLFALAIAAGAATVLAMRSHGSMATFGTYPIGVRLANSVVAHAFYLVKTVWPSDLAVVYPYPGSGLPVWQVLGSGLLLLAVSALAILLARSRPYVLMGWLWYLVTLAPVNGLVQQGKNAVTDHFSYIPLIGIFIIIAWGVPDLLGKLLKAEPGDRRIALPAGVLGAVAVLALMVPAYIQVGYWRNSITLFSHAIKVTRGNSLAYNNLGNALLAKGESAEAIRNFRLALKYHPEYLDADYNLGNALYEHGDTAGAIRQYRKVIQTAPKHTSARNNLGSIMAQQGKFDEAIEQYSAILSIQPNNESARQNLESARSAKAGEL